MSADILAALVPKGCEPPAVAKTSNITAGGAPVTLIDEEPFIAFQKLKQRLMGLPVAQYPVLLAVLVKGAWAAQAFEEGGIGEFVTNIEAGLDSALIGGKPEELVIFGLKAAPRMVEEFHERVAKGGVLGFSEAKFYERAGEILRLRSALKEFQDDNAGGGGESGEGGGAAGARPATA